MDLSLGAFRMASGEVVCHVNELTMAWAHMSR